MERLKFLSHTEHLYNHVNSYILSAVQASNEMHGHTANKDSFFPL